jgi:hypothetical protein
LQRKSGRTVNSPTTSVDTTPNNSEINSSDCLPSNENQDNTVKQVKDDLSALSGSSPGESSIGRTCSEDSKYSYKYPSSGDKSCNPFYQDATPKHPAEDNKKSPGSLSSTDSKYSSKSVSPFDQESTPMHPVKVLPLKRVTYTDTKMANFPPANLDTHLEHVVTVILDLALTHPLALGLSQSYINTFDDFRTIDIDDVHEFRYNLPNDPKEHPGTKLHPMIVKNIQCMACYARFKKDLHDTESDNPTVWDIDTYSKWCRNGYATYLAALIGFNAPATPIPVTSMATAFVTTAQKDDEAALISWNRKPCYNAKYPLLKNDADDQDWKLKMKRQLIADTLSRVTDPIFKLTNCRTGADI